MPSKLQTVLYTPAWDYSAVSHPVIDTEELVAEEKNPCGIKCYYPTRIGEVIHNRYQVCAKLGHGGWCTVWLARDLNRFKWQSDRFVAIKIGITGAHGRGSNKVEEQELRILKHINSSTPDPTNPGYESVRALLEHFTINSSAGKHTCLVFEPLQMPLRVFRRLFLNDRLPIHWIKAVARDVLSALDFLHTKCHIIHCDIKDENIIFKFPEDGKGRLLLEHARWELENPSRVKRLADRNIYFEDRRLGHMTDNVGTAVLIDYDLSVIVQQKSQKFNHDIQPGGLEAPEVLLKLPWTYSADIFNFGIFLCELIEGRPLFIPRGAKVHNSSRAQEALKRMFDYLGAPPMTVLEQADRKTREWLIRHANDVNQNLEESKGFESYFSALEGGQKGSLIAFVKRMLRWSGERRATAAELLEDPWLQKRCV